MKGVFVAILLIVCFSYVYAASNSSPKHLWEAEVRQGGGLIDILKAWATLLRAIIGILDGTSSADTLVQAVQGVFFSIERLINLESLVLKIPVVGVFIAPMIGGLSTIMQNTPMLGGLISQVLTGPSS